MQSDSLVQTSGNGEVEVVGKPLHQSPDELVQNYLATQHDFLTDEATNSVGDYCLIDTRGESVTIITSPMFSGGYVDTLQDVNLSAQVGELLADRNPEDIIIDSSKLYCYLANLGTFPFSTIFNNIHRLSPGARIEVSGSEIHIEEYVSKCQVDRAPETVKDLENRVFEAIAKHSPNLAVTFSGGVDSGLVYALLKEQTGTAPRLITFDWPGPTNNKQQAQTLAGALNEELEVVSFNHGLEGEREAVLSLQENMMAKDFVSAQSPYFSLTPDIVGEDTTVLTGQNFGEISGLHMKQLQFRNQYRLNNRDKFGGARNILAGELKRLARNFQFTDRYLESRPIREVYSRLISKLFPDKIPDPTKQGSIAGFIWSSAPNLVDDSVPSDLLDAEITELNEGESTHSFSTYYYYFILGPANRGVNVNRFNTGGAVLLPGSAGPAVAYMLTRNRGLSDVYFPKREFYEAFEEYTGVNYHDVEWNVGSDGQTEIDPRLRGGQMSDLLRDNKEYLESPMVFDYLDGENKREEIDSLYSQAAEYIDEEITDWKKMGESYNVLNVEMLVQSNT